MAEIDRGAPGAPPHVWQASQTSCLLGLRLKLDQNFCFRYSFGGFSVSPMLVQTETYVNLVKVNTKFSG